MAISGIYNNYNFIMIATKIIIIIRRRDIGKNESLLDNLLIK